MPDNKFRILKNGGVAAILAAMRTYKTEEQLQANGLKALCNLLESGKNGLQQHIVRGVLLLKYTKDNSTKGTPRSLAPSLKEQSHISV